MTPEQIMTIGAELERYAEELASNAHALIVQARDIQRRAERVRTPAMPATIPDGPEITE